MIAYRNLLLGMVLVATQWGTGWVLAAEDAATPPKPGSSVSAPNLRLVLPPLIHAVVGVESNVYFDNVCLVINPSNYVFDADCPLGRQQAERWTAVPTEKQVGDHALTVTIRDQSNAILAQATTTIRVAPAEAAADKPLSLLCIGDSLTHASVYPQSILDSCKPPGNPKLELVGSHWPGATAGPVRHEGYGGWTAERFATHFTPTARTGDYSKRGSPFLYAQENAPPRLDLKRYCQDVNSGKMPDRVTIFLGPNDIFSYQDDTLEAGIDKMLKYYDQLLTMIRTDSPSTRIGVMLPVPPAATQDAFGANYTNGQTRWQYKRNQHRLLERMIAAYDKRSAENIDLVATFVNLDCARNYPAEQVLANSRSAEKIVRQNNGVHPASSGYQQIGDSVYCWLKATAGK